jgi:hypothetical protein
VHVTVPADKEKMDVQKGKATGTAVETGFSQFPKPLLSLSSAESVHTGPDSQVRLGVLCCLTLPSLLTPPTHPQLPGLGTEARER